MFLGCVRGWMLSREDIVFQCFDATLKAGVTMLHCWKNKGKTNHLPVVFFFSMQFLQRYYSALFCVQTITWLFVLITYGRCRWEFIHPLLTRGVGSLSQWSLGEGKAYTRSRQDTSPHSQSHKSTTSF